MTVATSAARSERAQADPGASRRPRSRSLIALVVLGIALVAAPAVFQMFSRAPKGATMLSDFKPFMTDQRLTGFQQDIDRIGAAVTEVNGPVRQRVGAAALSRSDYVQLQQQWPTIDADMSDLLAKVHGNLGNYQAVAALPSFSLFPWFFVAPGVLIAGAAGFGLARPSARRKAAAVIAVIGIGLVAAPVAFQMFTRAPKGGSMMTAFEKIETTQKVTTIQGYFSTMAVGQGAIRLQIVPALQKSGLSEAQIAQHYPAITRLDDEWVHILDDMTPMIGAMSDNVANYSAVKALPPFPLFPWFFVLPGVLAAGLAFAARRTASAEGVS
jgi:hypothetical protein